MDQNTTTENDVNVERQNNQNTTTGGSEICNSNPSWSDIANEGSEHAQAITSLHKDLKNVKNRIEQADKEARNIQSSLLGHKHELSK